MQLGWIDFSRNERNKILQALRMLEKSEALDELGIGVIRDGYADLLFPGISTLQRRAKYFVLIPYLFGMAEHRSFKNSAEILTWINKQEHLLVPVLMKTSEESDEEISGIIGSRSHPKAVKVMPSSIYWNGMRTFEIIREENLSISNVCSIIMGKQIRKSEVEITTEAKNSDGQGFDDITAANENLSVFSPILPDYAFMSEAEITLTKKEAEYLYLKMVTAKKTRNSLLAFMLREKLLFPSFSDINESILSDDLRINVSLAKMFADFIYGAHIRYNVIFADGKDDEMTAVYQQWRDDFDFDSFNLLAVLSKVKENPDLKTFLNEFCLLAEKGDDKAVDQLIIRREKAIKRDRAKLCKPQEYRYDPARRVHYYKLNYRYNTAYTIINDVLSGMEG